MNGGAGGYMIIENNAKKSIWQYDTNFFDKNRFMI